MNAPPPFCTACTGNLRKLPKPTALPAMASMSPTLEPHESTFTDIQMYYVIFQR